MSGFSAMIGNPPFVVYKNLKSSIGEESRNFILQYIANNRKGLVDLSVYFLLQFESLSSKNGIFGLITTNSVKQGDNRKIGLEYLIGSGVRICNANTDIAWGQGATVVVDSISLSRKEVHPITLNGVVVKEIDEFLSIPGVTRGNPRSIPENMERSHVGSYLLGTGFILESNEAKDILKSSPNHSDVIFPYLGGKELNNNYNQKATRYAINFFQMPIEEVIKYNSAYQIILAKVKPFRMRKKDDNSYQLSKNLREKWWVYANPRANLYRQIRDFDRVIAIAQVSKTMQVCFVDTRQILDQKLIIFCWDDYATFAFLSSNIHIVWAMKYSSRMRNDLSYSPKRVFHTLKLPKMSAELESLGKELDELRNAYMQYHKIGLTELYKLVGDTLNQNDSIKNIRIVHQEIDKEVIKCYGWDDLELNHIFRETTQGWRWIFDLKSELEIIERLLKLNLLIGQDIINE